eukprot:3861183-Pyramimonas_sp.AAC.1
MASGGAQRHIGVEGDRGTAPTCAACRAHVGEARAGFLGFPGRHGCAVEGSSSASGLLGLARQAAA